MPPKTSDSDSDSSWATDTDPDYVEQENSDGETDFTTVASSAPARRAGQAPAAKRPREEKDIPPPHHPAPRQQGSVTADRLDRSLSSSGAQTGPSPLDSQPTASRATAEPELDDATRKKRLFERLVNVSPQLQPDAFAAKVREVMAASRMRIEDLAVKELIEGMARCWESTDIPECWTGTLEAYRKNLVNVVLKDRLAKKDFIPTQPLDIIRDKTRVVCGARVFCSNSWDLTFTARREGIRETPLFLSSLMGTIRQTPCSTRVLVGGDSGSGKSWTLLGLGATANSYSVLVEFKDFWNYSNRRPRGKQYKDSLCDTATRNAFVAAGLASLFASTVGPEAMDAMKRLSPNESIDVFLCVDEAGSKPEFVRALCAIKPSTILGLLGLGDSVRLRLLAAGTGVGSGDTTWGSQPSTYVLYFVEGVNEINRKIFSECLGTATSPFVLEPLYPVVDSNARIAALAGSLLRQFSPFAAGPGVATFPNVDVRDVLPFVALKFKSLNGLKALTAEDTTAAAVSALRMYLFPFAGTRNSKLVQTRWGLVVDRSAVMALPHGGGKGFLPVAPAHGDLWQWAPTSGQYTLPYFTLTVLSYMGNVPLFARSTRSGESFEAYWLGVSTMAACAAANAELFLRLLKTGTLAPMAAYRGEQQLEAIRAAEYSVAPLHSIPDALLKERPFALLTADLQDLQVDWRKEAYVKAFDELMRSNKDAMANESRCRIAAVRSPAHAPFADSCLFVDDTLFLFQLKDTEEYRWTEAVLREEVQKMEETSDYSTVVLQGMRRAWSEVTGLPIRHVRCCFVTPRLHTFGEGQGRAPTHTPPAWCSVTTDGITFLQFDPERQRGATSLFVTRE